MYTFLFTFLEIASWRLGPLSQEGGIAAVAVVIPFIHC